MIWTHFLARVLPNSLLGTFPPALPDCSSSLFFFRLFLGYLFFLCRLWDFLFSHARQSSSGIIALSDSIDAAAIIAKHDHTRPSSVFFSETWALSLVIFSTSVLCTRCMLNFFSEVFHNVCLPQWQTIMDEGINAGHKSIQSTNKSNKKVCNN